MRFVRKYICLIAIVAIIFPGGVAAADDIELTAASAILMEATTGTVLYEKNPDEIRSPASITKIMTLILTFEAIENGRISLEDEVTTSAYAKSMGGSQVFLEEGEIQTVDTLIKCIAVASGNDASVAMAEYIAGSEEEFVRLMNEKAVELGMTNTNFLDCCGLSSDSGHHTTARDVAIMSRELITKHPDIYNYTTIWMEDITHVTSQGSSTFTLSSTNKLLKQYQWTTGLKTGSTSTAKYCFSATASKNGIDMIAVIMGAPDYKVRFSQAQTLLEYGFGIAKVYIDENDEDFGRVGVSGAKVDDIAVEAVGEFRYLDVNGMDFDEIEKSVIYRENLTAPIDEGEGVGEIVYSYMGDELGRVGIVSTEQAQKAVYLDYLKKILMRYWI